MPADWSADLPSASRKPFSSADLNFIRPPVRPALRAHHPHTPRASKPLVFLRRRAPNPPSVIVQFLLGAAPGTRVCSQYYFRVNWRHRAVFPPLPPFLSELRAFIVGTAGFLPTGFSRHSNGFERENSRDRYSRELPEGQLAFSRIIRRNRMRK